MHNWEFPKNEKIILKLESLTITPGTHLRAGSICSACILDPKNLTATTAVSPSQVRDIFATCPANGVLPRK